ncbi:unnamed protein product [Strongylus vulgaris]|uniref:UV-stimulated scaffold protein A C-terminal domain-containing protein n=1 Tax=Strongylus vulgaris TaxID=40348 RepID=A0A3P7HXH7_STRVU|nr:unnamed protein product [Strongylus vulgaris]
MADDRLKLLRWATAKLINEASNKPDNTVDTETHDFKKLKNLVRTNEDAIPDYVDYLFSSLQRSDSERRKALLSLFDYFFNRSHVFRLRTVENLQELLHLVCETDPLRYPLPGPITEAKQLKVSGIKTIKKWWEKFGAGYEKLNLVGDYLKESKAVDFESATAEMLAERARKAAEEQRAAEKLQKIAANVRRKFNEAKDDIERCLTSSEEALSIVVPPFEADSDVGTPKSNSGEKSCESDYAEIQPDVHGYATTDTVSIVLPSLAPEVTVNEDNEAVLENIRDAKVMMDVYRKNIISWQRKIGGASAVEDLMRDLTNLKRRIEQQCEKIDELKLKPKKKRRKNDGSSESEESDLEDVPEKQLEDFFPPDEVPKYILDRVNEMEKEERPCCSKSLEPTKKEEDASAAPFASNDSPSKPKIPVVSFDLDLKYWGEKHIEPVVLRNTADCHRFWRPPDDDDKPLVSEKEAAFGDLRVITWVGEPRKSDKRCKARLSSGKLCPRMDFHK